MSSKQEILKKCKTLLCAYSDGRLGDTTFPEEQHPDFISFEEQLTYFTLPMALNYRRSSKQLWEAALNTIFDEETKDVFELNKVVKMSEVELKERLRKHRLALLLETSTKNWKRISESLYNNYGNLESFIQQANSEFAWIKQEVQFKHKTEFPFLSGPKIFNYWNLILMKYCGVNYKDRELIDIAPDVHVIRSSVKLGVISQEQSEKLSRQEISNIWREYLHGSSIAPIDMHPPMWFWSKNGYKFTL